MVDARTSLSRPELAPANREGLDRASVHKPVEERLVIRAVVPLRRDPSPIAEQVDQLLFGESFVVLRSREGFAWGQSVRSGYVGWAAEAALSESLVEPTHRVVATRSLVLADPTIRAAAVAALSLNALVRVLGVEGPFSQIEGLGWMPSVHIAPIGSAHRPVVQTARMFLGAPYAWGGKESLGLDCSGLVQQAFWAAGLACPRDADQQARLGRAVTQGDLAEGDLVCWRGHIGIMVDAVNLIHANAHHMAVAVEPLSHAVARIEPSAGPPTAFRRVNWVHRANT